MKLKAPFHEIKVNIKLLSQLCPFTKIGFLGISSKCSKVETDLVTLYFKDLD